MRKRSIQILEYLGEYKILPLFLPTQKSPKTHERHHGWKANNNETQQSNKTKKTTTIKQKPPTPIGRSNGRSPHPAHCHMGRVSILSK